MKPVLVRSMLIVVLISTVGAGPILVDTVITGDAVVWKDGLVTYNPETTTDGVGGELGRLSNEEARGLITEIFDKWSNVTLPSGTVEVSTVNLTVEEGASLGNVDTSNLNDHFTYCPPTEFCPDTDPPFIRGSARSGESPLLFDSDGSLTDMILGSGASNNILGFAGPRVVARESSNLFIVEAQAVLNGRFIDCAPDADAADACQTPEVSVDAFKAVVFHEMGHFLGLDHTQVNLDQLNAALSGDSAAASHVATMSALFVGKEQLEPHYDDKVAISTLYPSAIFLSDFCAITGTVFQSNGLTAVQGVNVIARHVGDPLVEATSFVSGSLFTGSQDCSVATGGFVLRGIRPRSSYTLEVEPISPIFQGGSSVEPCDPPQAGFDAQVATGTFSCESGGQDVTVGTAQGTDFVTTKGQSGSDGSSGAAGAGSGCSLNPEGRRSSSFLLLGVLLLLWRLRSRVFIKKEMG